MELIPRKAASSASVLSTLVVLEPVQHPQHSLPSFQRRLCTVSFTLLFSIPFHWGEANPIE